MAEIDSNVGAELTRGQMAMQIVVQASGLPRQDQAAPCLRESLEARVPAEDILEGSITYGAVSADDRFAQQARLCGRIGCDVECLLKVSCLGTVVGANYEPTTVETETSCDPKFTHSIIQKGLTHSETKS